MVETNGAAENNLILHFPDLSRSSDCEGFIPLPRVGLGGKLLQIRRSVKSRGLGAERAEQSEEGEECLIIQMKQIFNCDVRSTLMSHIHTYDSMHYGILF